MHCPHCNGHIADVYVEPLYTLRQSAELIPLPYSSLKDYLHRHKCDYPARYRFFRERYPDKDWNATRRVRLLTASEVIRIRARFVKGHQPNVVAR